VIVTEDLFSYRTVAQKINFSHQVCHFHVRRWVGRTLKQLQEMIPKEWLWVREKIRPLLETLPPEGSKRLYALWNQLPGRLSKPDQPRTLMEQLCDLLLRLREHSHTYTLLICDCAYAKLILEGHLPCDSLLSL
jgi:hypothetical protein